MASRLARLGEKRATTYAMAYSTADFVGKRLKRFRSLYLLMLFVLLGFPVLAQDEASSQGVVAQAQADAEVTKAQAQRAADVLTTARIRDLMAGKLDPSVDANSLFNVEPDAHGDFGFEALIRFIDSPKQQVAKPKDEDEAHRVARELFEARLAFFRLPLSKRQKLLESHARKRALAKAAKEEQAQELARLTKIRDDLKGMFEGKGPGESADALQLKVLEPTELLLNPKRRKAFLGEAPEELSEADRLRAEIDSLRKKYWTASLDDQRKLLNPPAPEPEPEVVEEVPVEEGPDPAELERQRKAETEAARAARERQQAIEAAKNARTESLRLIASEKARLLGVREQHVEMETEFINGEKAVTTTTEGALASQRKVRELEQRSILDGDKESDANALYDEIITQLGQIRSQLDTVLDEINSGDSHVKAAGKLPEFPPQINVPELEDLQKLYREIRSSEESLKERESDLRWSRAMALRDAMVTVNDARLRLLKSVSPAKRDALTGFGAAGVAQVVREFEQISLAARYHILALPRLVGTEGDVFMASPIILAWLIVKFLFVTSLFVWWRRRADHLLKSQYRKWYARRPQTDWTLRLATMFWYVSRVRKPLEWLIFLWALSGGTEFDQWPEIEFAKIVALWSLLGSFVIHVVDAIAEHQGDRVTGTSTDQLRVKSLRLVGVTIVIVGLTLSITEASVGRGAIYGWVSSTSWLFPIPISILLVIWWRGIVFERAERIESPNGLVTWVKGHQQGVSGYLAAAIGGIYLLGEGLFRWVYVRISDLTITRRFLAYLFRREVEKQASKATTNVLDRKISQELYDQFDPSHDDIVIKDYMTQQIAAAVELVESDAGAIIAIVGEIGLGKSDVLTRIVGDLDPDKLLAIQCDFGGIRSVLKKLCEGLGIDDDATLQTIASAVNSSQLSAIAIDDIHRMLRPVIGGLKELDQLFELIRASSNTTSWIVTIDAPAWQYLRRARAGQAVFDMTIILERWSEEQIAEFIEARCAKLNVRPNFDRLVMPAQAGGTTVGSDQLRSDYYRILWDYSRGNPSVAMHYWRESLRTREHSDEVSVKLYRPAGPFALSDIPSTHHFVLRTIVQLERCGLKDIVDCTGLSVAEVRDAVRLGMHREYIKESGGKFLISLGWYRAVIDLLTRQHLLALGGV